MADRKSPQFAPTVAAPQHYTPPTMRELRAEAVHRLQIGMSGLAAMLLLVGLANIIMERAQLSDTVSAPAADGPVKKTSEAGDPLAEIGVTPSSGSSASVPAGK
jgi:hypothetical protein